MDLLLLGHGGFAKRRIVPAVAATPGLALRIASRSSSDAEFRDYATALAAVSAPALVWISLTNDAHETWIAAALAHGHHVIVDKPAVVTLDAAVRLVATARAAGLVLAEATTYAFHPIWPAVAAVFAEHGSAPSQLTCALTPPLAADNFRWRRAFGGGALLDTGPYCASIGRIVWGGEPDWVTACIGDTNGEVDTSYTAAARYGAARTMTGHFAFTVEYRNHVLLAGPGLAVDVPGAFSTPPDKATELTIRARDVVTTRVVPAASAPHAFLAAVLDAIARRDTTTLADVLLADARGRDRLARAAAQLP